MSGQIERPRRQTTHHSETKPQEALEELLDECAQEPIRTPGAIQPHGALIAVDRGMRITRASRNLEAFAGVAADAAVGRPIDEVLRFPDSFQFDRPRLEGGATLVTVHAPQNVDRPLRASVHQAGDETVVEFEPASEERDDSGEGASRRETYDLITGLLGQTRGDRTIEQLCEMTVEAIRRRLGFDHVMIYRFDAKYSGEVVAESRNESLDSYLGLRFPASDIPEQARALYLETPVRALADVRYEPVELLGDDANRDPLDMSACRLRSMSPIHRVYLQNMGVAASVVLSIVCEGRLWGLVACHHATPRAISLDTVHAMALVSETISIRVQMAEERRMRQALNGRFVTQNRVLDRLHSAEDLVAELAEVADDLIALLEADGLAVRFGEDVWTFGKAPERGHAAKLMDEIGRLGGDGLFFSESLLRDLPNAAAVAEGVAGVASLQFRERDFILFFREEQARSVRWGGNPEKAVSRDASGRLLPRASFAEWVEQVGGRCRAWTDVDRETADDFRKALAVFVLRRTRELKVLNRRLRQKTDEIEQFVYSVSHDLKSPLVTCQGFLGVLREDLAAGRTEDLEDSIGRIERAATTMGTFVNDLLAFSQIGRAGEGEGAPVDLNEVVHDVLGQLAPRIQAQDVTVDVDDRLPTLVCRRHDALRVFDNLLSNALKYGCDGENRRIEVSCRSQAVEHIVSVRDWGEGIPEEYHAKAMQLFQRVHTQKDGTGVGLASVSKIVEQLGGRVWLENASDGGLIVHLAFPRELPLEHRFAGAV
ncbi:ATP-binding protein [Alienimonas chondri]|uniref:histidine kinase n=1 Tax=Alienimonas chondri TaxID=2681879 RepID=A0ABX1V7Z3_9PLAN|nr:ATP-binding protein [Alienimonas chondri]NNJ24297.1 Phytochrome-like protein cph1 [Alienimonas chondri]